MHAPKHFDRILWWGNVRNLSIPQRAKFAADHGFDAMNIAPADIEALLAKGETLLTIRAMAGDRGIALTYLDPVVSWLPNWHPAADAADFIPFLSAGLDRELEFAQGLGIDRVLTITPTPPSRYAMDALAEHLTVFANEMAKAGIWCVLEAMPMWGLQKLSQVETLRQQAGAPNIRLLFDTWHYCRAGREDDVLRGLPPGVIDHVQIADGSAHLGAGHSLFDDCLQHRVAPCKGDLPLAEILLILNENGHLNSVGPEVFSAEYDHMTADQIADDLMPAFNRTLAAAQGDTATLPTGRTK